MYKMPSGQDRTRVRKIKHLLPFVYVSGHNIQNLILISLFLFDGLKKVLCLIICCVNKIVTFCEKNGISLHHFFYQTLWLARLANALPAVDQSVEKSQTRCCFIKPATLNEFSDYDVRFVQLY